MVLNYLTLVSVSRSSEVDRFGNGSELGSKELQKGKKEISITNRIERAKTLTLGDRDRREPPAHRCSSAARRCTAATARGEDPSRCTRGRTLLTHALEAQCAVPEPLAGEGARGGAISSGRRSVCSGREIEGRVRRRRGGTGGGGATFSGRRRRPPLQEPSLAGGEKKGPARGRAAAVRQSVAAGGRAPSQENRRAARVRRCTGRLKFLPIHVLHRPIQMGSGRGETCGRMGRIAGPSVSFWVGPRRASGAAFAAGPDRQRVSRPN
jgi:hypothetical protein